MKRALTNWKKAVSKVQEIKTEIINYDIQNQIGKSIAAKNPFSYNYKIDDMIDPYVNMGTGDWNSSSSDYRDQQISFEMRNRRDSLQKFDSILECIRGFNKGNCAECNEEGGGGGGGDSGNDDDAAVDAAAEDDELNDMIHAQDGHMCDYNDCD